MHCISFICIQNTYEIHCIFDPILKDIHEYFFLRKNFGVKNLDFDPKMEIEKYLKIDFGQFGIQNFPSNWNKNSSNRRIET